MPQITNSESNSNTKDNSQIINSNIYNYQFSESNPYLLEESVINKNE